MIDRFKDSVNRIKNMDKQEKHSAKLGICFVVVLLFFFIANLSLPDASYSDVENRSLQQRPSFSVKEYMSGRLERKLEDYANDQFFGRNVFIRLKSAVDVSAGSVLSNGVWRGKSGYLMEDITVPDEVKVDKAISALAKFKKENKKIPMRFMLAPNAANIYSDKLPAFVSVEDQNKYINDFYTKLETTGITSVDIRPAFTASKDNIQLFYRTDHHWTTDGAKIAYEEFAKLRGLPKMDFKLSEVKNDFVGSLAAKSGFVASRADAIKLAGLENGLNSVVYYYDTQKKTSKYYNMKCLDKRDAYTVFGGQNHPIYTIKTPTKSNRRLLLIKDSYANSVIPFLMQNYREIVVVDPRYYYDDIDITMASEGINEVLFLYNANTFFEDEALSLMLQ